MQGGLRFYLIFVFFPLSTALPHPTAAGMLMFGNEYDIIRYFPEYFLDYRENPGYIRLGKEQMRRGEKSDPRNKSLMKMFKLIDIGEHAGSGVPNIFNVWEDEGWEEPVIEESFDPDRTSLILRFVKKQAIKTSDKKQAIKTSDKKQANKTDKNMEKIKQYLHEQEAAKTREIAELLGLSAARTRAILSAMDDVEALGINRNRIYRLNM